MCFEAERMSQLKFDPHQAKTELSVILEERNMTVGNNPARSFDIDLDSLFYRHHPYKNPLIGWENEIKDYTPQDVMDLYNKFYGPNNAILILYGDIDLTEAKKLTDKYYKPLKVRPTVPRKRVNEPDTSLYTSIVKVSPQTNITTMIFKFRAFNFHTTTPQNYFALKVIGENLANSESSLLYQIFVSELKYATSINCYYESWSLDRRSFTIQIELTPNISPETIEIALKKSLQLIAKRGFADHRVSSYKKKYQAAKVLMRDDMFNKIAELAFMISADIPLNILEDETNIINNLTCEDFNRAFKSVLSTGNYLVGTLQPEPLSNSQ